jgi:hypothetical protein
LLNCHDQAITVYYPGEITKQSALEEVGRHVEAESKQRAVTVSKLTEAEKILEIDDEEALDSTLRRTLFGRGHGPVVRQTAE